MILETGFENAKEIFYQELINNMRKSFREEFRYADYKAGHVLDQF